MSQNLAVSRALLLAFLGALLCRILRPGHCCVSLDLSEEGELATARRKSQDAFFFCASLHKKEAVTVIGPGDHLCRAIHTRPRRAAPPIHTLAQGRPALARTRTHTLPTSGSLIVLVDVDSKHTAHAPIREFAAAMKGLLALVLAVAAVASAEEINSSNFGELSSGCWLLRFHVRFLLLRQSF